MQDKGTTEGPKDGDAKPKGRGMMLGILASIGGAILLLGGSIAQSMYDKYVERSEAPEKRLDALIAEFEALDLTLLNAENFVRDGDPTLANDLFRVGRHFRKVVTEVVVNRVRGPDVAQRYGGRLSFWAGAFLKVGSNDSPGSQHLHDDRLRSYVLLGRALQSIASQHQVTSLDDGTLEEWGPEMDAHVATDAAADAIEGDEDWTSAVAE